MNSIRIILQSAIDYAGLFPPAALNMSEAAREYASGRSGDFAWAMGRFVLPASRLAELEADAGGFLPRGGASLPWRLSILGGADLNRDLGLVREFNQRHYAGSDSGAAVIDAMETRVRTAHEVHQAAGSASSRLESYFEVPLTEDMPALIATIARIGGRAKVRTGGSSAEQFPSAARLARFVHLCTEAGIPFKATAGLHHPFRTARRRGSDAVSRTGMMHGFLNLMLAAAFARAGAGKDMLEKVLEDAAVEAFSFDDQGVSWRGEGLTVGQLLDARQHSLISFGSCSLQEPWDDLKALNLL